MDPIKFIEGKKTYFIAGVILVTGILEWKGIKVPEFVWAAIAALGLTFLRAGVEKSGPTK
jgi:hypothetical protein